MTCVVFPPGDYQIDNSGSEAHVVNYGGEFVMFGAYGTQQGSLGAIGDLIASRNVTIDNPSGLAYTRF